MNWAGWVSGTPSTTTATDGSELRAWEMPRITTKEVPTFWVSTRVTFGVDWMKSRGDSIPLASIVWAVKAVTWAGTFCSCSERWRAVTMTSPVPESAALASAPAVAVGVSASAGVAAASARAAAPVVASSRARARISMVISIVSPCDSAFMDLSGCLTS